MSTAAARRADGRAREGSPATPPARARRADSTRRAQHDFENGAPAYAAGLRTRPATARTLRGAASQIAADETTHAAIASQKAST